MSDLVQGATMVASVGVAAHAWLTRRGGGRGPLHMLSVALDHVRAELLLLDEYWASIRWVHRTQKDAALWKVRR